MGLSGSAITMKIELCSFSGFKIYPGHGKRYVTRDGRPFVFLNGKCAKSQLNKRTRRTAKFQRAITGASLQDIMAKRNQKPEVRKAQREQAIRAAKEKTKAKTATKQVQKAVQQKSMKGKSAPRAAKPRVGGKR